MNLFERHAKMGRIWGVILHQPINMKHEPRFIKVGFIAKDYKGFAAELIDLQAIVDAMEEKRRPQPRLRLRREEDAS